MRNLISSTAAALRVPAAAMVFAIGSVPAALAQPASLELQSDWLELVKGHRDGKTGAEIMGVTEEPGTGYQTVMVKIPKATLEDESDMEEVTVTAAAPEKRELPNPLPELETQWVDDYDNDHYGLLIKFREDQQTPFRLFFSMQGQGAAVGGVSP